MFRERAHNRQVVSVEAKVLAPDLSKSIDCTVKDISAGGALVSLRSDARVPDRIYLWQAATETSVECDVRWRRLNLIGLQFAAPESPEVRALLRSCSTVQPAAQALPVRRSA